MIEPTVCCIMLTRDRPEMARKAVECFRAQTCDPTRRLLFILDTGYSYKKIIGASDSENEFHDWRPISAGKTIGELRNFANSESGSDIIIHWDDDDFSHPNRIAEQVALLQSSGADAVGFNEMLFWREAQLSGEDLEYFTPGEAWLYRHPDPNYCLGTSLCYWRRTWTRKPFEPTSRGEDRKFITGLNTVALPANTTLAGEPRMIARIHGGNTCSRIEPGASEWKRVPEWDDYVRKVMTL